MSKRDFFAPNILGLPRDLIPTLMPPAIRSPRSQSSELFVELAKRRIRKSSSLDSRYMPAVEDRTDILFIQYGVSRLSKATFLSSRAIFSLSREHILIAWTDRQSGIRFSGIFRRLYHHISPVWLSSYRAIYRDLSCFGIRESRVMVR